MNKCEIKQGIFVLTACNNSTTVTCDNCLSAVCEKHQQVDGPKVLCFECYAKAHPEKYKNMGKGSAYEQMENDYYRNYGIWYFGMRQNFYSSSHYNPFNETDYSGFNRQSSPDFNEEQSSGSFFDS